MLVLSRKLNEKIQIGGGIVITIVSVKDRRVRLGIQAPDDVTILRSELPTDATRPPVRTRRAGPKT
jgi:carbon storage regulator